MELYFLGTGAGSPSRERNVTSILFDILPEIGTTWLFDCGEGTQHQLMKSPYKMSKISKMFITHLHGDHIFGLPGFLTTRSNQGVETELTIYGPSGIQLFVETALHVSGSHLNYPLHFREVTEGTVFEDEHFHIKALLLDHRIESFGYRIEEKERLGPLHIEKLQALDIPPGPVYGRLKKGEKVVLSDGRELIAEHFLGPLVPGRIVTIFGDTCPCDNAITLAKQADVIVHESTFARDKEDRAEKYKHATSEEAATIAKKANAKTLILTHISSRYKDDDIEMLLQEAKQIFPASLVASDLWGFSITKNEIE